MKTRKRAASCTSLVRPVTNGLQFSKNYPYAAESSYIMQSNGMVASEHNGLSLEFTNQWLRQNNDVAALEVATSSFRDIGVPWARLYRVRRDPRSIHLKGAAQFGYRKFLDKEALREFKKTEIALYRSANVRPLSQYLSAALSIHEPILVKYESGQPTAHLIATGDTDLGLPLYLTGNADWPDFIAKEENSRWIEVTIRSRLGPVGLLSLGVEDAGEVSVPLLMIYIQAFRLFAAQTLTSGEIEDLTRMISASIQHVPQLNVAVEYSKRLSEGAMRGNPDVEKLVAELSGRQDRIVRLGALLSCWDPNIDLSIESLSNLISNAAEAAESDHRIRVTISKPIPPSLGIYVNRRVFGFVLDQVTRNACQAGADEVCITVSILAGSWVTILIADNGPGLTRQSQQEVFMGPLTTKKKGGLGLGMLACRRLIEMTGGRIYVNPDSPVRVDEESSWVGAQFVIEFPIS